MNNFGYLSLFQKAGSGAMAFHLERFAGRAATAWCAERIGLTSGYSVCEVAAGAENADTLIERAVALRFKALVVPTELYTHDDPIGFVSEGGAPRSVTASQIMELLRQTRHDPEYIISNKAGAGWSLFSELRRLHTFCVDNPVTRY